MSQDVSAEVADLISGSKVFGASDNIRHGRLKLVIERIHAQMVETDMGNHKMAFWECRVLESAPNPQTIGDRVDYVSPQQPGVGPLRDDGNNPNPVGSRCALKVDFDGAGGRSAGANIKAPILALFGKRDGEIPDSEINATWKDLARVRDLKVGDAIGIDPNTNQPILATKAKQANPACGMVIWVETMVKKKRTPNEKGMYVTKLIWDCKGSPIGVGENAPDLVLKRRAEIETARAEEGIDDEDTSASSTPSPSPYQQAASAAPAVPQAQQAAPLPPAPPAPPAPVVAAFTPPPPWRAHPTAPGYFWDGAQGVKSEAQLRAGQ